MYRQLERPEFSQMYDDDADDGIHAYEDVARYDVSRPRWRDRFAARQSAQAAGDDRYQFDKSSTITVIPGRRV